jgi:Rieske Fe-S protein
MTEPAPSSRREFLRVCAVGGAAIVGGGLGIWAVMDAPAAAAAEARLLPLAPLLRVSALPKDEPLALDVTLARRDGWRLRSRRQRVYLTRIGEGNAAEDYRALSPICPHKGCHVEAHEDAFVCPCHDARFSLAGERIDGPAPRGMDPLRVEIDRHDDSNWLFVEWQDFVIGTAQRTPRPA